MTKASAAAVLRSSHVRRSPSQPVEGNPFLWPIRLKTKCMSMHTTQYGFHYQKDEACGGKRPIPDTSNADAISTCSRPGISPTPTPRGRHWPCACSMPWSAGGPPKTCPQTWILHVHEREVPIDRLEPPHTHKRPHVVDAKAGLLIWQLAGAVVPVVIDGPSLLCWYEEFDPKKLDHLAKGDWCCWSMPPWCLHGHACLCNKDGQELYHWEEVDEEVDEEVKEELALGDPIVWEQRLIVGPTCNKMSIDANPTPRLTFIKVVGNRYLVPKGGYVLWCRIVVVVNLKSLPLDESDVLRPIACMENLIGNLHRLLLNCCRCQLCSRSTMPPPPHTCGYIPDPIRMSLRLHNEFPPNSRPGIDAEVKKTHSKLLPWRSDLLRRVAMQFSSRCWSVALGKPVPPLLSDGGT